MTLSVFYSYSLDYVIGRNGQPFKWSKKSCEGPMDVHIVSCNDCNRTWDEENTNITASGVFIRGEGDRDIR